MPFCTSQIEAPNPPPPPPRQPPPAFDFFENYRSNSPLPKPKYRSNAPGTLGSIQVIKRPHPRDISQAYEWQKDGRNACSFQTKSLKIQQIICIQYNKNWETLKAYLLQTKLLGKVAEITVTRSLNTQLFFVCHATYKAFYKKKSHLLRLLHSIHAIFITISWQVKVIDLCWAFYWCIESWAYSRSDYTYRITV